MTDLEKEAVQRIFEHVSQVHDLLMTCIKTQRVPPLALPTQLKLVQAIALKLKEN